MKQYTRRIGYIVLIVNDFILVFFSHFSLFNGSEASNNCPLSIIICPLFFLRKPAKRIMDRCQWTMDNYWKLGFHQKIKKGRKMRKENENKIIDNQHNISYSSGILFHCQLTRCPQGSMTL